VFKIIKGLRVQNNQLSGLVIVVFSGFTEFVGEKLDLFFTVVVIILAVGKT
jgi:hypothetical protein